MVGEGDGRFLHAFVEKFAKCERIDVIEPSARMCAVARGRIGEMVGVKFHQCAFDVFEGGGKYDLIVAHFFFDFFDAPEQRQVAGRMVSLLESGGTLLIADFQMPEKGWLAQVRARVLLRVMYGFFRLCCGLRTRVLSDPDEALREAGMELEARVVSNAGFLRSDRWRLRGKDCKKIGAEKY